MQKYYKIFKKPLPIKNVDNKPPKTIYNRAIIPKITKEATTTKPAFFSLGVCNRGVVPFQNSTMPNKPKMLKKRKGGIKKAIIEAKKYAVNEYTTN